MSQPKKGESCLPRTLPSHTKTLDGQYDDLEGAAERILHQEVDAPIEKPRGQVNDRLPGQGADNLDCARGAN
jgi:hypothetical protein